MIQQGNKHLGYVERPNIEAAAREGYVDRLNGRGFSRYYDAAPPPWQRNYEIGRLWATGMIGCGIEPPEWPETGVRQPSDINAALAKVNAMIGNLRPEVPMFGGMQTFRMPDDPNLPTLHEPVRIPRGRRFG